MNTRPRSLPDWLTLPVISEPSPDTIRQALSTEAPGPHDLVALLSPNADAHLESMAAQAQTLTRRHFGNTISLYAPLYLSDFCSGGCAYCGFAADRTRPRRRLEPADLDREMKALRDRGIEDVLLLTGEESPSADFTYLLQSVTAASQIFHNVTIESFAMTIDQYRALNNAGCTGVTLYQETYDPIRYDELHRWGPKKDYFFRLEAPERALSAGLRTAGLGVLLGLADPVRDALSLFQHTRYLQKHFWRAGIAVSFPRLRPEAGGFTPAFAITERQLARFLLAFRLCLPNTNLVLSTRESAAFRDGMAGLGVTRMSVDSRTTVGGYANTAPLEEGQFAIADNRNVSEFCTALRHKALFPVFKNWDRAFQQSTLS